MTLTLEERNKLAETIVETGGVWILPFNGRKVKVKPIETVKLWGGRLAVHTVAVEGKPFVQKDDYGEGCFITKSKHKTVYPEQLETVTEGEAEETDRQLHTENQRQPKQ